MFETLAAVGEKFRLPGKLYSYEKITQGNINTTYRVTYRSEDKTTKTYMFQRVNTLVFKNPVEIMENIDRVTEHIRVKNPEGVSLHFHHTEDGLNYWYADAESFWRVRNFVDSITYDICEDPATIAATGEAFGRFQMQLSDLDGNLLHETIPDFHNTRKRLDTLFLHVLEDPCGRAEECREEIEYISQVRLKASELSFRFERGEFPARVTHNDTKCNNVLFDRVTKRPLAVIDLDTVMPGMSMYDFADAVRFIANTAREDEPDLTRVYFDTSKFRAFCQGYIRQVREALTEAELDALVLATFSITVELAARFLDDYLTGDRYFKTNYPGHNLVRTRAQLRLAQDIMRKYDELSFIVRDELEKCAAGR